MIEVNDNIEKSGFFFFFFQKAKKMGPTISTRKKLKNDSLALS